MHIFLLPVLKLRRAQSGGHILSFTTEDVKLYNFPTRQWVTSTMSTQRRTGPNISMCRILQILRSMIYNHFQKLQPWRLFVSIRLRLQPTAQALQSASVARALGDLVFVLGGHLKHESR